MILPKYTKVTSLIIHLSRFINLSLLPFHLLDNASSPPPLSKKAIHPSKLLQFLSHLSKLANLEI